MTSSDARVAEFVSLYRAGRLTRRELIQTLSLLGLSASALGTLLAAGDVAAAPAPSIPRAAAFQGEEPKRGGTVVGGVYQEPNSLNWILSGSPISFATLQLYPLFEPLLRVNAENQFEPGLLVEVPTADNGGLGADGKTFTLRMRPGLQWDDGQPCTMRDFAFTWKWIMDPANKAVNTSGWSEIAGVDVPDDTTAVVTLNRVYVPFIAEVVAFWPLLPEHVQSTMTSEEYGRKPVGNGPFKFVEWVPGDHITFARNDLYWREPKAYLDQLIWKIVPDRNTVIAQAKTGALDLGIDYTEAQIPEMSNLPDVELSVTNAPIYERYHFTLVTAEDVTKPHPLWGDVNVRKAVTLAIDRQTIIDTVLFGRTEIAKNELDNTEWENTNIKPDPFDPEQAKTLLDEAGWVVGDGGIRAKDGTLFSFTHGTTSGNQTRETIQALVQANLKDVGIEMKIANEPASKFFGSFAEGGGYLARKLDMVGFTGGLPTADPSINFQWHSSQVPTAEKPNGLNSSGLINPELDQLLDAQLVETDKAERKALLDQAQQILHDVYPMVPMYDRVNINSIHKRVQGVEPITYGGISGLVWNTYEWWVK